MRRAKADGRWEAAYASQGRATPDPDLLAALEAQPNARRFFDSLDAANRYAVLYRVHQARGPDRRAAKIAEIVARLASGEAFHPPRKRRGWPAAREGLAQADDLAFRERRLYGLS